jgi:hypothetical protein
MPKENYEALVTTNKIHRNIFEYMKLFLAVEKIMAKNITGRGLCIAN